MFAQTFGKIGVAGFRRVWFSLLVVTLLLPGLLQGYELGKVGFYITNQSFFNYNRQAQKEAQFYETLALSINYRRWSAGLTLRANNFFKQNPNVTLDEAQSGFYRKFIRYNSRNLEVTVGDFYALLGRGMVLSVLENDDVLRERTILGGNIHYNKGRLDLRVLGGNVKDETGNQEWRMAGGEVGVQWIKNHTVGAHFSYIDDVSTYQQLGKRLTYSVSLRGNRLFKNVSYYAELATLNYDDESMETGHGFYSNVTYSKGRFTGFLEYKRYRNFNNEMNNPPVGDRTDEFSVLTDTDGGRVHLQYAWFEPDISFFVSLGRYSEYGHSGPHYYGGVNAEDLGDRLSFSLSYGVRDILYPVKKLDGHLVYQLSDVWSVEMTLKDKRYRDNTFTFTETDHILQISFAPYVSVYGMHQYSHNKVMGLNDFFSGGIRVYLRGGSVIELSGGAIRGGQICAGGQCYTAPPFKGVKFSLLHTFK